MPKIKSAKRAAKRLKTTQAQVTIQKMEKGFLQAPAKLAAIIQKEITKLGRQTDKQKKAAVKLTARIKNNQARLKSPADAKTAIAKKKAKLAQKAHQYDVNVLETLQTQLETHTESLNTLTKQHSKLVALDKQLIQFEKEWAKSTANSPVTAKTKQEKSKNKTKKTDIIANDFKAEPVQLEELDLAEAIA